MLWIATERGSYLVVGTALFAVGAYFAWRTFNHVQDRVDPLAGPVGDARRRRPGASTRASRSAGAGSASPSAACRGTGPGLGRFDRLSRLIETDFIFTVIGEELGLLGGTLILVAFLLLVGTGLRIAVSAEHAFDKLLAVGLTALLGFQAFIIIAGVTRLLPLTGVTLPFVSYGGSSLIANYVILALLMRISDDTTRRQSERDGRRNRKGPAEAGGTGVNDRHPSPRDRPRRLLPGRVRDAQLGPGLPRRRSSANDPRTSTCSGATTPATGGRSPRPTARSSPGRFASTTSSSTSASTPRATSSRRSPATTPSSSAPPAWSASYDEELVGDTAQQQLRGFADLFVGEDQVGNLRDDRCDSILQAKAREQLGQRRAPSSPSTRAPVRPAGAVGLPLL